MPAQAQAPRTEPIAPTTAHETLPVSRHASTSEHVENPVPSSAEAAVRLQAPVVVAEPPPASPRDGAEPQPNALPKAQYTVHCAFRRYESASTTVLARSEEEACQRALEHLENEWDAWILGEQDGPTFVDAIEKGGSPVDVPRRYQSG